MYQKTAAKNGGHEPADVTSNIAALSRIVPQHVLLPPTNFLAVLNTRPLQVNNNGFNLSPVDMELFNDLIRGKLS
ncbi:hypothetical protein BYT27DRAFT_7119063 [Phlegmacium glaucopus]|nr:hypothetical protein BYT27DRAFT_7119063 [Phlegmacium glaucopus]